MTCPGDGRAAQQVRILGIAGKHDDATLAAGEEWAAKSLALDPDCADGLRARGCLRLRRGDVRSAVRDFLRAVALEIAFEDEALWELAVAAEGSMRDALSLTDQAIAYGGGSVAAAAVTEMLGYVDRELMRALVDALLRAEPADVLAAEGVSCEVVDLRTVRPLDRDAIVGSVRRTRRLLVVDEDYREFGLSGELAASVLEAGVAPAFARVCVEGTIPYARALEDAALPSVARSDGSDGLADSRFSISVMTSSYLLS